MKNRFKINMPMPLVFIVTILISGCGELLPVKDTKTSAQWYEEGKKAVQTKKTIINRPYRENQKAKNIIFVLGDGMGVSTLTAARIFVGQQQGLLGEEFSLSFEQFPHTALVKTYNVDLQTPDSAGTMSALMTGVKTNEGIISLPDTVQRGECADVTYNNQILPTFVDLAKAKGKSTAMVTTARVTHATPATTYAHSSDRNWESDEYMPQAAKDNGCQDIASQWVDAKKPPLDVLFGGGRRHFLPAEQGGKRLDKRNLIQDWLQKGRYVSNLEELKQLTELNTQAKDSSDNKPWLGLFASSHMEYAHQRSSKQTQQPGLKQMTEVALKRLQKNENGFALVIESGRIDHGHHVGIAYKALTETQELHETVAWLLTQVDLKETLIVVTADHSHTLTLAGETTRGNPILGNVVGNDSKGHPKLDPSRDNNGQTYTSLAYRDGPGAISMRTHNHDADTQTPNYQQIALVPMDYETHGGEDVALYAIGPQSQLFSGTLEQHWVFHALKFAL